MRGMVVLSSMLVACGRLGFGELVEEPGSVAISELTVEWASPNLVSLRWAIDGDPADVDHYELLVGESEAAATTGVGATRLTPAERPELGFTVLPDSTDPAVRTQIEVTPGQIVFASLIAVDLAGNSQQSAVLRAQAPLVGPLSIVLFDDSHPTGSYPIPDGFVEDTADPHTGTATNVWSSICSGADCFENLRRQGLAAAVQIDAQEFASTYLEMFVAHDGPTTAYWAQMILVFGNCADCRFEAHPFTVRGNVGYQRIQMPLRLFRSTSQPRDLSVDDVLAGAITEWGIGGNWGSEGTIVRIDDVRIVR